MTKFRHLPIAGRLIIVAVAIGVFAIAVVACATSYNAIYRLVGDLGLYGYRINQAVPAHARRGLPGRRAGRHPGRDHAGRHPLRRGLRGLAGHHHAAVRAWGRSASTSPTPI